MLKSLLQSRYWLARPSARLVQQTALLFKELPLCFRGCSAKSVTQRAEGFDLLRVALLATDWNPQQKLIRASSAAQPAAAR
jgi:hypothetical protein